MPSLSTVSPWVAALVVAFGVIRLVVRHDQAVLRLVLSVVVVVSKGPRSKKALALLRLHSKSTSSSTSTESQEK